MKANLALNGLDPKAELARHEQLAAEYREKLAALGRKRNWRYRDILLSMTYHQEEAEKLRKEGIC
jgi:hypothetical protein